MARRSGCCITASPSRSRHRWSSRRRRSRRRRAAPMRAKASPRSSPSARRNSAAAHEARSAVRAASAADACRCAGHAVPRGRPHVDTDRGLELDTRANVGVYGAYGVAAGLFAQATWASEKHFAAYYGVRESGLLFTSLGALASYELTHRWQLVGSVEGRHLSDEAAKSAIVQRRSAAYANAGLAYRF